MKRSERNTEVGRFSAGVTLENPATRVPSTNLESRPDHSLFHPSIIVSTDAVRYAWEASTNTAIRKGSFFQDAISRDRTSAVSNEGPRGRASSNVVFQFHALRTDASMITSMSYDNSEKYCASSSVVLMTMRINTKCRVVSLVQTSECCRKSEESILYTIPKPVLVTG
jgi:hypothetical protein